MIGAGRVPASRSFVRGALHLDPVPPGTQDRQRSGSKGKISHPGPQLPICTELQGLDRARALTDKAGCSTPEWGGLSRVLLVRNMPVISLQVSCGHQTAPTSKWPWLPAWRQPGYDVTKFWAG
jgi:hypothetical protein